MENRTYAPGTYLAETTFLLTRTRGLNSRGRMNEVHQLANALLTIVFAAVMFVVGHLYIENKSTRIPAIPANQAFMPWTNPL
jgi:hypothetical protein